MKNQSNFQVAQSLPTQQAHLLNLDWYDLLKMEKKKRLLNDIVHS